MFIDVTRAGSPRRLRLAVPAIAYLDETPAGAVVHLVGGEILTVGQTPAEIEARVDATIALSPIAVAAIEHDGKRVEFAPPAPIASSSRKGRS